MPRLLLASSAVVACLACRADAPASDRVAGHLENPAIREASGLACPTAAGHYWVLNDGGSPAELFRVGFDGDDLGSLKIDGVENTDWEDLAAVRSDDGWTAVVADIGDNAGARKSVALHLVHLPDSVSADVAKVARSIRFRYPDGPRDAESIAVDAASGTVFVLSKRTIPAELYAVSLDAAPGPEAQTAAFVSYLDALPQPSQADVRLAPIRQRWDWQPTAMDFADSGRRAAILTYEAVYVFERGDDEDWPSALASTPRRLSIAGISNAEALCLTEDAVVVTVEAQQAPLYRFAFGDPAWRESDAEGR